MSTENLIRITVFASRNPKLSEEEYHKHWAEKHAPLVSSWLQRHGIVKYTQVTKLAFVNRDETNNMQYHTTSAHKNLTSQKTLSYDGMADFYVNRYEDFEKAYGDPYYEEQVKPDEEYLFDVATIRVMVGAETCVIEGGKIVDVCK